MKALACAEEKGDWALSVISNLASGSIAFGGDPILFRLSG